ncbi:hypothetical protein T484DRAFT_1816722 [Baffinella frigidus]|nr:hypothetical protein T484DRAFT_1816722 [Cryptophyta sp. CCMP2293]
MASDTEQYTSETLMQNLEVQLRYLSPVKAKEKRTFDKQESAGPEDEQLEYSSVTMEKYFQNCFNFKEDEEGTMEKYFHNCFNFKPRPLNPKP